MSQSLAAPAFSWSALLGIINSAIAHGPEAVALLMSAFRHFGEGVSDLEKLATLFVISVPAPATTGPVALSADESEAKVKVLALLEQHGGPHAAAFGDGKWAERIGKLLQNPLFQSILAGLLQKYLGGLVPGMGP